MVIDNQLVYEVITGIVGLLLSAALVWLSKFLKSKLTAGQIQTAQEIAAIAVDAIEQMTKVNKWDNETKYVRAALYFTTLAKKAGITLDEEQVKMLIEGAVKQINDFWEELPKEETKPLPA